MRVLARSFEKDGAGQVTLIPEETEDLWHIYNLVAIDDDITSRTSRKVQRENAVGSVSSETKHFWLTLTVNKSEYDSSGQCVRFSGRNKTENLYIKLGQYHTVELPLGSKITIAKQHWDFFARKTLSAASDPQTSAEVAVVLIDFGIANLYLLTASLANHLGNVNVPIPKRRGGLAIAQHDKAKIRFFTHVLEMIKQSIDFQIIQCVVIAGPGFVKDDFLKWVFDEAARLGYTQIATNRARFISCNASSPYKHSLNEVLTDKAIEQKIANTKAAKMVIALNEFYKLLHRDPHRACYGPKHVEFAIQQGAVKTLMLTDTLFRNFEAAARLRYAKLVEDAKNGNATVLIFSERHVSGEQLQQLGGIAAELRYGLPELDELEF